MRPTSDRSQTPHGTQRRGGGAKARDPPGLISLSLWCHCAMPHSVVASAANCLPGNKLSPERKGRKKKGFPQGEMHLLHHSAFAAVHSQ